MAFDFKAFASKFWESVKKVNPFAPALSYGPAKEVFEKAKGDVIKNVIKPLSLPLFLTIVILILLLIFWKKIQNLIGI